MATKTQTSRQRGNVLVEFALSSSLLFLFFFGIVDFSRLFTVAELASIAAQSGTQWGALQPANYGNVTGIHDAALNGAGNPTGMSATPSQFCTCSIGGSHADCTTSCGSGTLEKYLEVDVSMPFSTAIAYPGLPSVININRTSIVRIQ